MTAAALCIIGGTILAVFIPLSIDAYNHHRNQQRKTRK